MRVAVVVVLAVVASCGRKGFSPDIDAAASATDPDSAVAIPDGALTICGDGICQGNDGELCNTCAPDCKTLSTVCGNGACENGEAPSCVADCGPATWQWTAEEQQLVTLINNTRANGYKCPGTTGPAVTRPPLTYDPALQAPAREWAWEMAHQNFWMQDGSACNGRTAAQREAQGGFVDYNTGFQWADVQTAFNDWLGASGSCSVVMTTTDTTFAVGVAFDLEKGYAFVLK